MTTDPNWLNAKQQCEAMRTASGGFSSDDKLVRFLYLLARDHLPAGTITHEIDSAETGCPATFTNGWLARWAQYEAARLRDAPPPGDSKSDNG